MPDGRALLEARGISKRYSATLALQDVDLVIGRGEVHALLGENGAGKSTLIKILTGAEARDSGTILLDGQAVERATIRYAQRAGVWAVHQEVMVLPNLSVAENVMLGHQPTRLGLVNRRETSRRAREVLSELHLTLDVDRPVGDFPVAVRQLVAIARAVRADARLLVLDEPTASLDGPEVERLFGLMRGLTIRGTSIIFITHFLDQVYAISDRITVLRNGRSMGTFAASELPRVDLVRAMIGKTLERVIAGPRPPTRSDRAVVARFRGVGKKGLVEPFDLTLRAGEAFGAAGLLGSGRTETALLMAGAERADQGTVEIAGRQARFRSPRDAIRSGLAFSPEDRKVDGLFADLSIRENLVVALQAKRGWLRKLPRGKQQELSDRFIKHLNIRTTDADKPVAQLSGGNQQKVLLARSLATSPTLLILDEPTRGIDVGAHAEIVEMIETLRDDGMALYVISSELEELVAYSDRISVMQNRRQVRVLEHEELSVDAVVAAIAAPARLA